MNKKEMKIKRIIESMGYSFYTEKDKELFRKIYEYRKYEKRAKAINS